MIFPILPLPLKCILMSTTTSKYLLVNELTFDKQYCLPAIIHFGSVVTVTSSNFLKP